MSVVLVAAIGPFTPHPGLLATLMMSVQSSSCSRESETLAKICLPFCLPVLADLHF